MNDLTGKKQFIKNASVSWGVHIFIVIAGFIVPRQIDHSLGAVQLGIWDLGWASVQYMTLTGFGIGSALNRYIGMYRAADDTLSMVKVTTAAFVWQIFIAFVIALISIALSVSLPYWAEIDDQHSMDQAQIVMLLLGMSLAVKMLFDYTGGVLTGYHYWWMLNGLIAFQDFSLALLMVGILLLGGDLVELSIAVVTVSVFVALTRMFLVKKYCKSAVVDFKQWDTKIAKQLLLYGVKNIVARVPQVLVFQTAAMLLVGLVNPAALALFNRGVALIRQIDVLVKKIVTMFVPITSSLLGLKRKEEAKDLLLQATLMSMCMTLPGVVVLVVFGDLILGLWMGGDYAYRPLMITLAIGSIIPIGTSGTHSVMAGFNAHGKMVFYGLVITVVILIIGSLIVQSIGWSVLTVAILCSVTWSMAKVITMPYYLRKYFNVNIIEFFVDGLLKPIIMNIPLAIILLIGREAYVYGSIGLMLLSVVIGLSITATIYWKYAIPANIQIEIKKIINKFLKRKG